jgi:CheY-like chemotaxis protein
MTTLNHEHPDFRGKTVLIVEDDDEAARVTRCMVERQGFKVVRAENGAIALDLIVSERPDVILVDVVMPVMDGLQFLAALRKSPDAKDIPVIVLALQSDDATVDEAWRAGAALYLPKPFSCHELTTVLRHVLADAEETRKAHAAGSAAVGVTR